MLLAVTLYFLQANKTSSNLHTTRTKIIFYYLCLSFGYETVVSELNDGRKFLGLIGFNNIFCLLFIIIAMINNYF